MTAIFVASFIFVFIKAFQQLNVVGGHYFWVLPTSLAMAGAEATVIIKVATMATLWAAIPMGFGGGTGAMLAMYIHKRFISKSMGN